MSQNQVQTQTLSKISLRYFSEPVENARAILEKYCYLDSKDSSRYERPYLLGILHSCQNELLLKFAYMFFSEFILPFYDLGRTSFNKLRASFMRQIIIAYEQDIIYAPDFQQFYLMYGVWLCTSGLLFDSTCKEYYDKIVSHKLAEDWLSISSRINQNKLS